MRVAEPHLEADSAQKNAIGNSIDIKIIRFSYQPRKQNA
jgi:hypothetical protein